MTINRWQDLSPRARRALKIAGVVEGALKVSALVDLWRRDPAEVRGGKKRWAAAILVVNSAGALPLYYFLRGRRS